MRNQEAESFNTILATHPEARLYWETHWQGAEPALLRALVTEVDESPFGFKDWVEGLSVLANWLDARGLELACEDQIGYVTCSAAAVGSGGNLSDLPTLVADFLEQYGCDLAVKK
ncbi:MAG: hypothetical protein ACI81V_000517 [Lentimonas sp.]|jgi:hypothetical protein